MRCLKKVNFPVNLTTKNLIISSVTLEYSDFLSRCISMDMYICYLIIVLYFNENMHTHIHIVFFLKKCFTLNESFIVPMGSILEANRKISYLSWEPFGRNFKTSVIYISPSEGTDESAEETKDWEGVFRFVYTLRVRLH